MSDGFYEKLLAEHGDSPRALDWSEEGQRERFKVLKEVGIGPSDSVLDVGCGLGHFLDYLSNEHLCYYGPYIGVDSSEEMIKAAQHRIRGWTRATPVREFAVMNAFDKEPFPMADFVVSSGIMNVTARQPGEVYRFLKKCFDATKVGCAVNMLSWRAPRQREDRFYYPPSVTFEIATNNITPYVTLRHDYRENDFTLYLYHEPRK